MSNDLRTAPTPAPPIVSESRPASRPADAPGLVRVTSNELTTLFATTTAPEADLSREALRLPPTGPGDPVLLAGFSSLVLRGLAEDERGRLVPVGRLAALAEVLFTATQWVEAVGTSDGRRHAALVVVAPCGTVIMESRPTGIWQALAVDAAVPGVTTAARYVAASFGAAAARPFGGVVTVADADGARTAGVKVHVDGTWTLVHGPVETIGDPMPTAPDPTFRVLADLLR